MKTRKPPAPLDPLAQAIADSELALTFVAQAAAELDNACAALDTIMDTDRAQIAALVARIAQAKEQQDQNVSMLESLTAAFK